VYLSHLKKINEVYLFLLVYLLINVCSTIDLDTNKKCLKIQNR